MATTSTANMLLSTASTVPTPSSPSSLRSPAPPSSGRSPSVSSRSTWSTSPTDAATASPILSKRASQLGLGTPVVAGAEGGAGAIGVRRRESNSFKTMSTGSLVSNSPFTKRLGAVTTNVVATSSPASPNVANGLYGGASRIPTASRYTSGGSSSPATQRKTSGSRKVSGEQEGPVKENFVPLQLNLDTSEQLVKQESPAVPSTTSTTTTLPRSRSTSPSVPFRPVRSHASTSSLAGTSFLPTSTAMSTTAPFKPSRPTFSHQRSSSTPEADDGPRRQSSSYAALRKNGLVSTSPFNNKTPSPPAVESDSPPLVQAPYEIAPLSHESAPMSFYEFDADRQPSPVLASAKEGGTNSLSLGRPTNAPSSAAERRIAAGAAIPPPNTPPHQRTASTSTSPATSSLSPQRRGMRGPREPTPVQEFDGEETETEDLGRTLRRQPSNKTVTWAREEEVLEFDVESRYEGSEISFASSRSDEHRYGGDHEGGGYRDEEGDTSLGFAEGGSIEVHDIDTSDEGEDDEEEEEEEEDEDRESAVSSTVDELVGQINEFMVEESFDDVDIFSPSQIDPQLEDPPATPSISTEGYSSGPVSTFSVSTASDNNMDDVMSQSSYDDDGEQDMMDIARQNLIARAQAISSVEAAPRSPGRPPLPSPPTQHASAFSLSPPTSSAPSMHSAFSLPDIPGTSPFLGFDDDGAAESVVTLDMEPRQDRPLSTMTVSSTGAVLAPTLPLQPHRTPSQSTPTSSPSKRATSQTPDLTASDSPILSAFSRRSPPPQLSPQPQHLSRQASLLGSDVAPSTVSYYGSISSGTGSIFLDRSRLDQKMAAHQALLSPGGSQHGRFPDPSTTTTAEESREILARPAPKARNATLSSSMLPTLNAAPPATTMNGGLNIQVGARLTSEMAEEMQSPLERLQRGVGERAEGGEWRSGDSLLGVAAVARGETEEEEQYDDGVETEVEEDDDEQEDVATKMERCESASSLREKAIIARKRSKLGKGPPGKGRRRSLSTGDAGVPETRSAAMEARHTMPELGVFKPLNVQASLDDIYNARNRTYKVREHVEVIHAADISAGIQNAGDIDAGRAWRKKRPSNVHGINRSLSVLSVASTSSVSRRANAFSGQLFVSFGSVEFEGLPLPRERSSVSFWINNGRDNVNAGHRVLDPQTKFNQEFELLCSEDLKFTVTLLVPPKPPTPAPALSVPPPPSPTKSPGRGFRNVFSSPKKKVAVAPHRPVVVPAPDPFYDYVTPKGQLARLEFTFLDHAAKCRLRKMRLTVPFTVPDAPVSKKVCRGSMSMDVLWLPGVPGIPRTDLPQSMHDVVQGLEAAAQATKITHEGVLTQLGGDCTVWRRRNIKLRGTRLVPYSEVTKNSYVEIDLSLVTSIQDLNAPPPVSTPGRRASRAYDTEAELNAMDHSFRLSFGDDTTIDFYADDEQTKTTWLKVLRSVVGSTSSAASSSSSLVSLNPPAWAVAVNKLPVPAIKA